MNKETESVEVDGGCMRLCNEEFDDGNQNAPGRTPRGRRKPSELSQANRDEMCRTGVEIYLDVDIKQDPRVWKTFP